VLSCPSHKVPVEDKVRKGVLVFGHIASKVGWFVFMQIQGNIGSVGGRLALGQKGFLVHTGACIV